MAETVSPPERPRKERKERKENADRRRRQLIEATLRSVVANGLSRTTLATVAKEAGLSQGVAVFYFRTKDRLFAEALAHQYSLYEANWKAELAGAGDHPADRLTALIRADFSPKVCNPEALAIWFAFWGEAGFRPRYAETARRFDDGRSDEIAQVCADLMPDASPEEVRARAVWIDLMTDGFWQKLYLSPEAFDRKNACDRTMDLLCVLFPAHAARFAADD